MQKWIMKASNYKLHFLTSSAIRYQTASPTVEKVVELKNSLMDDVKRVESEDLLNKTSNFKIQSYI